MELFKNLYQVVFLGLLALLLVSCGGGGGEANITNIVGSDAVGDDPTLGTSTNTVGTSDVVANFPTTDSGIADSGATDSDNNTTSGNTTVGSTSAGNDPSSTTVANETATAGESTSTVETPIDGETTAGEEQVPSNFNSATHISRTDQIVVTLNSSEIIDPSEGLRMELSVGNIGNVPLNDLRVLYRVPEGLFHHWLNDAIPDLNGCSTCVGGAESYWEIDRLDVGKSRTLELISGTTLDFPDGEVVSLVFTVTGSNLFSPVVVERTFKIRRDPVAEVTINSDQDPVQSGGRAKVQIDVGNTGTTGLSDVTVFAKLPENTTASAISDNGSLETESNSVVWAAENLPVLKGITREFDLEVNSSEPAGSVLSLEAGIVNSGTREILRTAERPLSVTANLSSLNLHVATSTLHVGSGSRAPHVISITNQALVPISDVRLNYRVPFGSYHYWTNDAIPDFKGCSNCAWGDESYIDFDTIPSGSTYTALLNSNINSELQGGDLLEHYFLLEANQLNSTIVQSSVVRIDNQLNTPISIVTQDDALLAGDNLTVEYVLGNTGSKPVASAYLLATLPPNVSISSSSAGGVISGSSIKWELGTLPVRGSVSKTLELKTSSDVSNGVVPLVAVIGVDGDPIPLNKTEHSVSISNSPAPIEFSINSASTVSPGNVLRYLLSITNKSFVTHSGISLYHRVPQYMSYHWTNDIEPNGNSCSNCSEGSEQRWDLPAMEPNKTILIEINATIDASAVPGSLIISPFVLSSAGFNDTIYKIHTATVIP